MPDPRIAAYLSNLEKGLAGLPDDQRRDALREVGLHLDELVAQHRAEGLAEDEAVELALRRFGPPYPVGAGLQGAWAGRPAKLRRIVAVYVVSALVIFTFFVLTMDQPTDFPSTLPAQVLLALVTPAPVLSVRLTRWARARRTL